MENISGNQKARKGCNLPKETALETSSYSCNAADVFTAARLKFAPENADTRAWTLCNKPKQCLHQAVWVHQMSSLDCPSNASLHPWTLTLLKRLILSLPACFLCLDHEQALWRPGLSQPAQSWLHSQITVTGWVNNRMSGDEGAQKKEQPLNLKRSLQSL